MTDAIVRPVISFYEKSQSEDAPPRLSFRSFVLLVCVVWVFEYLILRRWSSIDWDIKSTALKFVPLYYASLQKQQEYFKQPFWSRVKKSGVWAALLDQWLDRKSKHLALRITTLSDEDQEAANEAWNRAVAINPRLAEAVKVDVSSYDPSKTIPGNLEEIGRRTGLGS